MRRDRGPAACTQAYAIADVIFLQRDNQSTDQLLAAMGKFIAQGDEWPPNLPMMVAQCAGIPSLNSVRLELRDPTGRVIDGAGDGGAPFFGGRQVIDKNYSMERVITPGGAGPGEQRSSWKQCSAPNGGVNVTEAFRPIIIATPGEPNSQ
jgi:hypothetical protein